jgi:SAM-dependent methyltransferase
MSKNETEISCCKTQCETSLDQSFWNTRWQNSETGWDIGYASPAIAKYMEQYTDKNASILIPGCGNAYEAEYLSANGFTNITLIDIAPKAVEKLKEKFEQEPQVKILCEDFFKHNGRYDLIIEQTFFCAIAPSRRNEYAQKTATLLNENGKVIGLLFNKQFNKALPPFGGSLSEYKEIFEPYFTIHTMELCYNSIPPRAETELFINLIKK